MSNRPVQPHPSRERVDMRAIDWLMGGVVTIAVIVGLAMLCGGCRAEPSRGEPSTEATAAPRETTAPLDVTPIPPMVGGGSTDVVTPLRRAIALAQAARIQAAADAYRDASAVQRIEEAPPEPTPAVAPEVAETVVVQATRQAPPVVEAPVLPPSGSLEEAIAASDLAGGARGQGESGRDVRKQGADDGGRAGWIRRTHAGRAVAARAGPG